MSSRIDTSPGTKHQLIAPHDSNNLAIAFRSIIVGGKGNLAVVDEDDVVVTYENFVGRLPFVPKRINATNTTATNIVGIY
jgi:hypothetical protein